MPPRTGSRREPREDARRNRERILETALGTLHREGTAAPMATIAADAGVGVGTLYRHFPGRDDLLDELTLRSFERMVGHVEAARATEGPATEGLRAFLLAVIADRDAMLLPSTGGPPVLTDRTRAAQRDLHRGIQDLLDRGAADGSIGRATSVQDIAWLGASLASPGHPGRQWTTVAARLLDTYLAGLGVPRDPAEGA